MFHILLDTEVFRAENLHFSSKRFRRLADLARGHHVTVYVTDITVAETRKAIVNAVAEALELLRQKKVRRILGVLVQAERAHLSGILELDRDSLVTNITTEFERLLLDLTTITISSDAVPIAEIRDRYFEARPPFSAKTAKKYEFPDAISLLAAEGRARAIRNNIFVVSADQDIASAAKLASRLDHFASLSVALSHIWDSVEAALSAAAEKAATVLRDTIAERVRDLFVNSGFYVDDEWYGDVDEVVVKDIDLGEPYVGEVEHSKVTLEFLASIEFTADIIIDDPEKSAYDSETGETMVFGQLERTVQSTFDDLEVSVELEVDTSEPTNSSILSVELQPGDFSVKFPWTDHDGVER